MQVRAPGQCQADRFPAGGRIRAGPGRNRRGSRVTEPLTVAFPKGRIAAPLARLFARPPLEIAAFAGRGLVVDVPEKALRFLLLKDFDVPTYVRRGAAELGIAGSDVLAEKECDLPRPLEFPFGRCRFSLLAPESNREPFPEGRAVRVATKYVRLTRDYFDQKGMAADIVPLAGSVEIAPRMKLADMVADLVDTGRNDARERSFRGGEDLRRVTPPRCQPRRPGPEAARRVRLPRGPGRDAVIVKIRTFRIPSREAQAHLERLSRRSRSLFDGEASATAARALAEIRRGGDRALARWRRRYDGVTGPPRAARKAARVSPEFRLAFDVALRRLTAFHRLQKSPGALLRIAGSRLEERIVTLDSAGVYIPGGEAPYVSTALMTILPARIAGVPRIAVATPPSAYDRSAELRYALEKLRVTEVYRMGGAHAIAALAVGTRSVPRVAKIVGPGNRFVTAAKRLVSGLVGIDGLAGPDGGRHLRRRERRRRAGRGGSPRPGRARRGGGGPPRHDFGAAGGPRRGGSRAAAAPSLHAGTGRPVARALRRDRDCRVRFRGGRLSRELRSRAPGCSDAAESRRRGPLPPGRSDLRGRRQLRGVRRLRCRIEPRPAHQRDRALRFGALGAGLRAPDARRLPLDSRRGEPRAARGDVGPHRRSSGPRRGGLPAPEGEGMSPLARRLLRPEMKDVGAYATSTASAPVRLDRNESPEEMAPQTRQRVLDTLSSARWSRYPDPYASQLKSVLAARERLAPDSVIVGNGSNSLFLSFFLAAGFPGRRFGLCPPTFGLFAPWIRGAGCRVADFPLGEEDLAPPVGAMLSAAREDPDLTFVLCSPNNPTGTLFPREGLVSLLETGALVVLDEAYVEFSGGSARDLLPRFPNLVLSRTLSKAAALAGARIGYMLGSPEILAEIEKVLPPFGLNLFARAAALASLEDEDGTRARVKTILTERGRMERTLSRMPGARLSASQTNFLYLRPERPAGELFEALLSRGILVRRVAGTRTGALRVTVGRPDENDRFLEAWKEVTS